MAGRKSSWARPAERRERPRAQLISTYRAVNSSNVSSWPDEASWPPLSAASLVLVLKLFEQPTVTPGTGRADRDERGTTWRMEWDRKKVERAATRRRDVDDIRKVGGGRIAGFGESY
jgi:hypothetical protein